MQFKHFRQKDAIDCGPTCLRMIAKHYGRNFSINRLHALDDWDLTDKKDYEVFAAKYPMNGELKQQDEKVEAMSTWCKETGIAFTPTFFINGYQLPYIYNVGDFLSS